MHYAPKTLKGGFFASHNSLINLDHGPRKLTGTYECSHNKLTSLRGAPRRAPRFFSCENNNLRNLMGSPNSVHFNFNCNSNQLTSLKGAPNKIGGNFNCAFNKLTSLRGIHKYFKGGWIKGRLDLSQNPITSHVLGVMLIPELKGVDYWSATLNVEHEKVAEILNYHLQNDRDVIQCQQDLIDAGLKAYAQL